MVSAFLLFSLAATPEVALLSSSGDVGELRFQPLGAKELTAPVVRFTHGDGSDVLGALLPKSRVVVATATMSARGDLSFASSLLRLEAGKPPRVLADQVVYGTRPLVTADGRVFVARGTAGPEPLDGQESLRVDALTIDELNPTTAARRQVYATQGYMTFLAGALGRELVVFEVSPAGARLIAVHVDTLGVRVVASSLTPRIHDPVVDAPRHRVLFTAGGERFSVEAIDLLTGAATRLVEGDEITLLPTVLPDGRVLISDGPGQGLRALDGGAGLPRTGPGFERVRLQSAGLTLGLHERPGDFAAAFAWKDGARLQLRTPPDSRLDLAGVTP